MQRLFLFWCQNSVDNRHMCGRPSPYSHKQVEEWDHTTATEAYREYAILVKEQIDQAEALEQV